MLSVEFKENRHQLLQHRFTASTSEQETYICSATSSGLRYCGSTDHSGLLMANLVSLGTNHKKLSVSNLQHSISSILRLCLNH